MSEESAGQARGWLGNALAFARSVEPREVVPRRAVRADIVFAAVALVVVLIAVDLTYRTLSAGGAEAAMAAAIPLAGRRRFPLAAFLFLVVGVIAAKAYATNLSFLAVVVAAYSASVHSRFRGLALLCVTLAGAGVADVFWRAQSFAALQQVGPRAVGHAFTPLHAGPLNGFFVSQNTPWRLDGLLALVALVSIAIVGGAAHAGERIRRLQAGHQAATNRALELERARIASELHDVVTHNVSVMIVQAGAARQVLDAAPGEARAALLAVEASGRAAMSELRHLLGLLSPSSWGDPPATDATAGQARAAEPEPDLLPQPGLSQLPALINRMTAAGLPVRLIVDEPPPDLPPGLDLAAFRVVQEALTNVLKHAGKPATSVSVDYRNGSLLLEVTDSGRPIPAAGPVAVPDSGRGLLGLRERVAVYGGELEAGPQPGGGWRVRARIPVDPIVAGQSDCQDPAPAAHR